MRAVLLLLLVSRLALAEPEDGLLLTAEDLAPYNFTQNGKFSGVATEKIEEIMRRTRIPYRIQVLPWARAYHMAQTRANTCAFSTNRTPEREAQFRWIGPLGSNRWTLYGLAKRDWHIDSLEAARPLRIGTYNGDSRDSYLRARGFQVDASNADASNMQKLLLGRIDLWASSDMGAGQIAKDQGLADKVVPVLTFNRTELYLACHASLDERLVTRMNEALRAMQADGSAAAIDKRYAHLLGK